MHGPSTAILGAHDKIALAGIADRNYTGTHDVAFICTPVLGDTEGTEDPFRESQALSNFAASIVNAELSPLGSWQTLHRGVRLSLHSTPKRMPKAALAINTCLDLAIPRVSMACRPPFCFLDLTEGVWWRYKRPILLCLKVLRWGRQCWAGGFM